MQSRNPVFARAAGFNGRNANGNPTYAGNGQTYAGYGDPSTWSVGGGAPTGAGHAAPPTHAPASTGPMTIDSVVQKTGLTMLVVVLAAAATWLLTGNVATDAHAQQTVNMLAMGGAIVGFGLAMANSFKRLVSPALVLAYAVCEGVFIGAMSKVFEAMWPGVVVGAVLGTVAAVGGTLAAYKFFNIRVSDKFRKWVTAAMFGFVAVVVLDFVLGFFHASFGFNGLHGLGFVASIIGLGLGVLMLILDFDYVEKGIAAGLPERESWRAAFGLTVTIVWIYIEMLRILAALRGN
ncbi:Bax inhibitor-1/YccA family protein [Nocardioides terrisoli]|uniref:Bax inhibitor-1/YccA family protein n=1 Tax=Nocardioides terrisoli TaxID=3388267 RepID=UPI00287B5DC9|nr:Bax inhibitor-1/YccA family protein [Nocardioides marmorisolisilvae]